MPEEPRYLGQCCRRCGCALLENETFHCGGKNEEGENCSAIVARAYLTATGGIKTWRDFHPPVVGGLKTASIPYLRVIQ